MLDETYKYSLYLWWLLIGSGSKFYYRMDETHVGHGSPVDKQTETSFMIDHEGFCFSFLPRSHLKLDGNDRSIALLDTNENPGPVDNDGCLLEVAVT